MGMFRKDWGGGHVYIDTIHPTVHSQLHIVHRASRVGENLCLKPQRRNLRKVLSFKQPKGVAQRGIPFRWRQPPTTLPKHRSGP